MEHLPNELWLLVYSYLRDIDVFYSFYNLNNRFNNLMKSNNYHINLSDISLKILKFFINDMLWIHSNNNNIQSILLKNNYQLNFFHDNQIFQLIKNLKHLKIIIDNDNDHELIDFLSLDLPSLQELTELHIEGSFDLSKIIHNINNYAPPSLTHLILLSSSTINYNKLPINLPNLKYLKIHLVIITDLFGLIAKLHKLEELYISFLSVFIPRILHDTYLPKTLIKLHLEYGQFKSSLVQKYFGKLKDYLLKFQNQIQFLTLIITSREREYTDIKHLELLEKIFPHLKSFEYLIHTTHCPSNQFDYVEKLPDKTYLIYTKKPRRPISFAHQLRNTFRYGNISDTDVTELCQAEVLYINLQPTSILFNNLNIDYSLMNLIHLCYETKTSFDIKPNETNFLSKLLLLSSNLKVLELDIISPIDILHLFKHISYSSTTINSFAFKSLLSFDEQFFIDLSQILPNLKYLYLHSKDDQQTNQWNFLIDFSCQIQQYFKKLLCINWRIKSNNNNNQEIFYSKHNDFYYISTETSFYIFF